VRAWLAWVEAAGSTDGAAWPRFHRHGRLLPGRLSDRAVSELLKRAAGRAGLNPAAFSGHSLRAGLATAARLGGASMEAIMEQAGWKSSATALRYIRPVDRWHDNAAARTGLYTMEPGAQSVPADTKPDLLTIC
jgi:integrase